MVIERVLSSSIVFICAAAAEQQSVFGGFSPLRETLLVQISSFPDGPTLNMYQKHEKADADRKLKPMF